MDKLKVKKIIIFKIGVSYQILEGNQKGDGKFELEFKIDEMPDVLKSLFVLDTSEKGFISSISYDAALDTHQLLKSIMLNIPDTNSFSSLLMQIKGARVKLTIGSSENLIGTIMGIEHVERLNREGKVTEKLLTFLLEEGVITKIPFSEIKSFKILNEDLRKDLMFYLDTIIAGKKKDSKKIVIHCESGGNDDIDRSIIVSFIRESPVWKTSYRLIMSKQQETEGECLISCWALVENVTNEDWEDIELTLTAGLPVSFRYQFYKPIFIDRPVIQPPKILSARPTEIEEETISESFKDYDIPSDRREKKYSPKAKADRSPMPAMASTGMALESLMEDMDDGVLMDKLQSQTTVRTKDLGELFEYNITNPVSIKRKQSALVPIANEKIKARKVLQYNKNVNDKNPNACLEITNNTSLTLERGPVTIIIDNNLAGEAIIPFLNKDDTRLLNYAVEQAVIITHEEETENLDVHKVEFGGVYAYEYNFTILTSMYKIKNKTSEEKELYLDHPKTYGYKVIESPLEPEETPNFWRFKLKIKPKEAISFEIKERNENSSSNYIWNWTKDDIIKKISFYVKNKFINQELEKLLREIGELIGKKQELNDKISKLEQERDQMTDEQDRLRENISVLGGTSQENALREKYVKKLSIQEERYERISEETDVIDKKTHELDAEIDELIARL